MIEEQTLVCKDCNTQFQFSAEQATQFNEKGYKHYPSRCDACRQKLQQQRRPRERGRVSSRGPRRTENEEDGATPQEREYRPRQSGGRGRGRGRGRFRRPLPPPKSIVTDSATEHKNGRLSIIAEPRGSGYIGYDGGHVYWRLSNWSDDAEKLKRGAWVHFTATQDEQGRISATKVWLSDEPPETYTIRIHWEDHDDIEIEKPQKCSFRHIRSKIDEAHENKTPKVYKIYHNDELVTYDVLNALQSGDELTIREEPEAAAAQE